MSEEKKPRDFLLLMAGGVQVPITADVPVAHQWEFESQLKKWFGMLLREVR